jgi:hypothetical protein
MHTHTQAALKLEAAASYVEEALKSKEAVEAENAAAAAKAAEDEAVVSPCCSAYPCECPKWFH